MCPSSGKHCAASTRGCAFAGPGPINNRAGGSKEGSVTLCPLLTSGQGSEERTAQVAAHLVDESRTPKSKSTHCLLRRSIVAERAT